MRTRGNSDDGTCTEIAVIVAPKAAEKMPKPSGSSAPKSGSVDGAGGETERALDCLMVLEAVARGEVAGGGHAGGTVRGRVRLGALIVETGLGADPLREILAALGRGGLVEGGAYGRSFGLTPGGLEALENLGIGAASVAEFRRDLWDSAS